MPPLTLNAWLRYDVIRPLIQRLDVGRVLEIGTGQGAMATRLAGRFEYTGLEMDPDSYAETARKLQNLGRGRVVHGDLRALDPDERFDLICAFEVLEHLEDDVEALRRWRSHLDDAGWLLLSVPAFQDRFGPWDEKVGHYRRYERVSITRALEAGGFQDVSIFTVGFPLGLILEPLRDAIARRESASGSLADRTAASGRTLQPPAWAATATRLASGPFRLVQRGFLRSDLGTGFVVLARAGRRMS